MGMDQLLELVDMRYRGLKKIRKTFSAEDITYENNGGYELIGHQPTSTSSAATSVAPSSAADPSVAPSTAADPSAAPSAGADSSVAPSAGADLTDLDQLRSSIDEFNRSQKDHGLQKTFRLQNENIAQFDSPTFNT